MKTAIIKTQFWDDESFEKLHLDSKCVYYYLLANPERGLAPITRLKKKICAVRTGLSVEHVEKGLEQLMELEMVAMDGEYYVLLKDYVEPKKGRFTDGAIDRELSAIPKDTFDNLSEILAKYTGIVPVHKDIYKDKDNNKYNNTVENEKVSQLIKEMEVVDIKNKNYYGNTTQRAACKFIIENYSFDNAVKLIREIPKLRVTVSYFPSITTPCELRDKWVKAFEAMHRQNKNKKPDMEFV